jgi:adenine deaminase
LAAYLLTGFKERGSRKFHSNFCYFSGFRTILDNPGGDSPTPPISFTPIALIRSFRYTAAMEQKTLDLERLRRRLQAARGEIPSDLVLAEARVACLYTGEWQKVAVALFDGVIVGLGDYPGPRLELPGRYLLPGFIDGHLHLESTMLTPGQVARAVLPRGTTAIVADPHEIANVWGTRGLDYLLAATEGLPVDFFFMLPSCVPASPLGTSGATLKAQDLAPYREHPRVLGLAEVMNFPGTVAGDPELLAKIALFPGGPVDGHAPLLSGKALNAYRLAGPASDHECTRLSEAQEKLRLGFYLKIREGSLAQNLADLLPALNARTWPRCLLVTDDCHPEDLKERGHLDHLLRRAVSLGLDPLEALTLVTLNPAGYFGLRDRGAIAPGLKGDLVVVNHLEEFQVEMVFKNGRQVAAQGHLLPEVEIPEPLPPKGSFRVALSGPEPFSPPVTTEVVKVIGLIPGQLLTEKLIMPAPVRDGRLAADPERDLAKLAVVDRHHGSGRLGLGLVRGFGLRTGALASTVAHDSHNLALLGVEDRDLMIAARHVSQLGGGLAVVKDGAILADLPLPVAGLLSPAPLGEVASAYARLREAYRALGGTLPDPFMALSFLSLEVIPELKLTDLGLVEVARFQVVPLFGTD